MKRLVVIEAPTNLGLRPQRPGHVPGVHQMPDALRRHDIVARLGATEGGRVEPAPYDPAWRPGGPTRNAEAIRDYSLRLAERVGATLDAGGFPIVTGGDCSVLPGDLLALRRRGRFGLVYIDGHHDFRHPGNSDRVDAVAGEDLALVTGRGSDRLTDIDGMRPYVLDADVIAIGNREFDDGAPDIYETRIETWELGPAREIGFAAVAKRALERLQSRGTAGFWLHLDADVLDSDVMPAVDSPQPDGLSYQELSELVVPLLRSGKAAGMELTIYDPDLDPDGTIGARFVTEIVGIFQSAGWIRERWTS